MITALAAAKAYASQGAMSVGSIGGAPAAKGMDFGDLLKSAMNDVTQTSKAAEIKVAQQVAGKAELIDVVTAISSAEASLETVMAVRDQVISAYQEIMRMPI
ncbi:flagellar hook-basal body complex protein FliE [Caulobacter sp. ErkDOM-E]|jgi:flagellar hook-basal body complex protein FliE|uniref:flagellar hook-basal body complex protein FliE n=1 Tax=Caulobacter sp. ErkDOM-E TaxID=3402778 RepID=UPI003AF58751